MAAAACRAVRMPQLSARFAHAHTRTHTPTHPHTHIHTHAVCLCAMFSLCSLSHTHAHAAQVQQEVALCIKFNHPNVVRSLHCVTFEASEQHQQLAHMQQDSLRSASTLGGAAAGAGGGGVGAAGAGVGAGAAHTAHGGNVLSMETWIVLEYCNAGW